MPWSLPSWSTVQNTVNAALTAGGVESKHWNSFQNTVSSAQNLYGSVKNVHSSFTSSVDPERRQVAAKLTRLATSVNGGMADKDMITHDLDNIRNDVLLLNY